VISGIGGLGHMAVQYAKAMGLNVLAVDVDDSKLQLAKRLGAALAVNASTTDPVAFVKKTIRGARGVLVTAVSPKAFEQALNMADRGGTIALNGLPPGDFSLSIFDTVLNGIRCADRSSGPASICRKHSISPPTARSKRPWKSTSLTTSTACLTECGPARSTDVSSSTWAIDENIDIPFRSPENKYDQLIALARQVSAASAGARSSTCPTARQQQGSS
jgi:hypothetical protein